MSALADYLVPNINFQAGPSTATDVATEPRSEQSSQVNLDRTGRLVGAAGLYTVFVTGMLWSAPAWVVVIAPFVQMGVGRLMLWSLWR